MSVAFQVMHNGVHGVFKQHRNSFPKEESTREFIKACLACGTTIALAHTAYREKAEYTSDQIKEANKHMVETLAKWVSDNPPTATMKVRPSTN